MRTPAQEFRRKERMTLGFSPKANQETDTNTKELNDIYRNLGPSPAKPKHPPPSI